MENNRTLKISTGGSRKALTWQQTEIKWSAFCQRLATPTRGTETYAEYLALPKSRQDELKDVGGFVGGTLAGGRRKAANVTGRDLITLDLDNIPAGGTDNVLKRIDGLGCAAVVYSTRKHVPHAPRLRIVLPTDRTAKPDEYEPVARKLAELIGIELCDPTTFEAVRLMYWPSVSKDGEYVFRVYDRPFLSMDGVLGMYTNWHDVTSWPRVQGEATVEKKRLAKQEDPLKKAGAIGAFCRTYTITEAITKYLHGLYEPTEDPWRWTYTGGSTVGGAVIYDHDRFLFSHHATDPCSGQLVNAFDLVRIHLYGDRDADVKPDTPANRLPSFLAMQAAALSDEAVARKNAQERSEAAREAFSAAGAPTPAAGKEEPADWRQALAVTRTGAYQKTTNNMLIILQNDPETKDKIITDVFAGCGVVLGSLPWNASKERRMWDSADDDGCYWYLETAYGISSRDKQSAALSVLGGQHKINAVEDYLRRLEWDGEHRVDTLLVDYLGADDNAYTRAVTRKSLTAAVARAIVGGVKYDYMPILAGPQGIGKSTFLATLGKEWFSDSLTTFEGKDAAEMIRGTWINEIGELSAMNKQETAAVKQFLSKRDDIYRAAYGKRTEKHVRRCVFFGTTNDTEFLKDDTGNRRFWPVDVGVHDPAKDVWKDLPKVVDQIWAEAYVYWQLGEPLYLTGELQRAAEAAQEEHRQESGWSGLIQDYLERPVPRNWNSMSISARRMFLGGHTDLTEGLVPREKVCIDEIWVECLGGDLKLCKDIDRRRIGEILRKMPGWARNKNPLFFGPYGRQKGYVMQAIKRLS